MDFTTVKVFSRIKTNCEASKSEWPRKFFFQIQKSILRDAVSDLALHFLDKIKCLVVKDIDREDVEFVCKSVGCRPIASLDHFVAENLVGADLVEEVGIASNRMVKITGKCGHLTTKRC